MKNSDTGEHAVMKKLLRTPQLSDPDAELRRFRREIRAQSDMKHSGIMPILAIGKSKGTPMYIMPRADKTLADEIGLNPGGIAPRRTISILLEIVDAVEHAHQRGVYHRDLKPPNVLMVDGQWKVGDFGLCRDINSDSSVFTQAGTIVGTVAYMAPEQFDDGHSIGPQADVFALGRILYAMLTARSPFPTSPIDRLPADFQYLYIKATAEEPIARFQSVAEFGRALASALPKVEKSTKSLDRSDDLVHAAMQGEPGAVESLITFIEANSDNEAFFRKVVGRLPRKVFIQVQEASPLAFSRIVKAFDAHTCSDLKYNYVDVVVDFFDKVFLMAREPIIRSLALRKIMNMGYDYNRYHAGRVLARLIAGLKDRSDILMAVEVMRENPSAVIWHREYLTEVSLPGEVMHMIDELG